VDKPMPKSMAPAMGSDPEAVMDAPEESAGDGYEAVICVYPDGTYRVKKKPLEADKAGPDAAQDQASGEEYTSLEDALRGIMRLIKANPVGESTHENFQSGFAANSPKPMGKSEAY
jgi:hypothetical protein